MAIEVVKIDLDEDAIKEAAKSDEMTVACLAAASDLADQIRALTPVRDTPKTGTYDDSADPGEMRDSITVLPNIDGSDEYDFGARVAATDHRFHWIEFGTGGRTTDFGAYRGSMPAYGPFRRTAEAQDHFNPAGA